MKGVIHGVAKHHPQDAVYIYLLLFQFQNYSISILIINMSDRIHAGGCNTGCCEASLTGCRVYLFAFIYIRCILQLKKNISNRSQEGRYSIN